MRDESADLLDGIGEAIEIGRRADIQVEIFHFKVAYAPGWGVLTPKAKALIEQARADGVNVAANMYVYEAGGTGVDITVPNWVWADGHRAGLEKLKDPDVRARVKRELAAGSQPGWSNLVDAAGGWDRVVLANGYASRYAGFRGKSFAEIGRAMNEDPSDFGLQHPDREPARAARRPLLL